MTMSWRLVPSKFAPLKLACWRSLPKRSQFCPRREREEEHIHNEGRTGRGRETEECREPSYFQVGPCHDGIAEIAGPQTCPLQAGQSEIDTVHLTIVKQCSFQVGAWTQRGEREERQRVRGERESRNMPSHYRTSRPPTIFHSSHPPSWSALLFSLPYCSLSEWLPPG